MSCGCNHNKMTYSVSSGAIWFKLIVMNLRHFNTKYLCYVGTGERYLFVIFETYSLCACMLFVSQRPYPQWSSQEPTHTELYIIIWRNIVIKNIKFPSWSTLRGDFSCKSFKFITIHSNRMAALQQVRINSLKKLYSMMPST